MTEKIDVVDALAGLAEDLRSHGNFVDRISDAVAAMKKERDAALAEIERLRGLKAELPPRPGDIDDTIVNLPRYGIRWNGPTEPISVPMDDGYWTPWHLAQAQIQQAVDAFHDASRLRSLIQQARIKAENERDEARAEIERLRTYVDRFQWANEMGCENTPNPACQCPGCETARERADRGETGP